MGTIAAISLGDAAIAAVAILLGVYELWLYARRPREREHLWVALTSFSAAGYASLMMIHYNVGPDLAVPLIKLELVMLIAVALWLPLMAFEIVGRRPRALLAMILIPVTAALALVPTSIMISDQLKERTLLLLDRPFLRFVETPAVIVFLIYIMAYALVVAIWFQRNRPRGDPLARSLLIAVMAWIAIGGLESFLGIFGLPAPMTLFEYGYVGLAAVLVWNHARKYMEMLAASERDFLAVIDRAPDAVAALQGDRVVYANEAFRTVLGMSQLRGRKIDELVHSDDLEQLRRLRSEPGGPTSIRVVRSDGRQVELEVVAVSVDFEGQPADVLMARDVTARKQLTARMMEMDRMISVGALAAAVGHEINNPLSYVILNLEELQEKLGHDPALAEPLKSALDGAGRIGETVKVLHFFSRPHATKGTIWLDQVIRSAVTMAGNEVRHRAQLELKLEPRIPVWGNETRLGQVFVNLLVNAAQAVPEGAQSENWIRVSCRREGGRAVFEVSDSGAGIEPHRLEQVFDAFYTTKGPDEGLGLGLGISRETIRAMGGELTVSSSLQEGTTLRGELPVVVPERKEPVYEVEPRAARRARVLVVDDEPLVLGAICRALQTEADAEGVESTAEALERIAADDGFDLILTDVMMPNGSGFELYEQLRGGHPALAERVVFMSGGVFTDEAQALREKTENPFIAKPLDLGEVRRLLRQAVEQADGDGADPKP